MTDRPLERRSVSKFDKAIALILVINFAVAAVGPIVALQNRTIVKQRDADRIKSRNESCNLFERQERTAVIRVTASYHFLNGTPRKDYGTFLVKAIVRQLGDTYTEARDAKAPSYCDRKNVGLPERTEDGRPVIPPLPSPPCRPGAKPPDCVDYSRLLKPAQ